MHIVKSILTSKNSTKQQEDLKAQMLKFLNILLQLAKNEQMFSTLLQFMFSDPNCIPFCTIILEVCI